MKNVAYIGLGSNIGDRTYNLRDAIMHLGELKTINILNYSSIYETAPVGYMEQGNFLNMVIKVETELKPYDLLEECLNIELILGRKRDVRWGPRTIDLDILLYNNENVETESLQIPHPRMQDRAFVMVPLAEIAEDLILPMSNRTLSELVRDLDDREGVRVWKQKNGEEGFELFEN